MGRKFQSRKRWDQFRIKLPVTNTQKTVTFIDNDTLAASISRCDFPYYGIAA